MAPQLDLTRALPALVLGFRHALYENNRQPGSFGPLRMRVAMAHGVVAKGATGYEGQTPIVVCRMVDSQALKDALADHQEADLALCVSDTLYTDVVKQEYQGLPSDEFTETTITVKEYTGRVWITTPPAGPVLTASTGTSLWTSVAPGLVGAATAALVSFPHEGDPAHSDPFSDEFDPLDAYLHIHGDHGPSHDDGHHHHGGTEASAGTYYGPYTARGSQQNIVAVGEVMADFELEGFEVYGYEDNTGHEHYIVHEVYEEIDHQDHDTYDHDLHDHDTYDHDLHDHDTYDHDVHDHDTYDHDVHDDHGDHYL
ncbi:hypothetical protein ACFQ9X_29235 [Catenulispora yoronensis]